MELKRKTACKQCPFRRKSLAGWLGDCGPREFVRQVLGESEMPCHMTVDYSRPDWQTRGMERASYCAGALIFLNNNMKRPRNPKLAALTDLVGRSALIFKWPKEFIEHHTTGSTAEHFAEAREKRGITDPNLVPTDYLFGIPVEEETDETQ